MHQIVHYTFVTIFSFTFVNTKIIKFVPSKLFNLITFQIYFKSNYEIIVIKFPRNIALSFIQLFLQKSL